ncbi:MAG: peptidoglycan-binding protein [Gemmobacter sp.]|jgi:peptidoglycan hydrolase-like protein with peptidoglycan-binding domain|nr:peptidoglycan-binding protein [Gemmobacter sp.]
MKQVFFLLLVVMIAAFAPPAGAQEQIWLQIEAQPTLSKAEDRARAYAALFPDVAGFALGSGWYAVVLGPYQDRAVAEDRLAALKQEGMVPRDSYLADRSSYRDAFWPAGPAAPAPEEEPAPPLPPDDTIAAQPPEAPEVANLIDESPAEARAAEAGLTADERRAVQAALHWFGFYRSGIDGAFGPGTRKSMAAWQEANGREPTGVLTTMQRETLVAAHALAQAETGLAPITEAEAGIEIVLPTALIEFSHYEPPFVHYREKNGSGVQVILISQPGDQSTLYGLYDALQTLETVPLDGARNRSERSFTIDGRSGGVASHSYAELSKGLVKGYMLIWNPRDDDRMAHVLAAMQESFRSTGDKALDPGLVPMSDEHREGLMSGLVVRRPALSRSGFYVDGEGAVLTVREAVEGCNRVTLDLRTDASVVFSDAVTGLALVRPARPLAPPAVADLLSGSARPGQEIAVSGYSYEDRLPAPTLTFGTLEDMKGLDGEAGLARLSLTALPGDAGGPVLDGAGAVIGMLLPRDDRAARRLPDSVAYVAQAATIAPRLAEAGLAPRASTRSGALAPADLNRLAEGMTVLVSCW